MYKLLIIIIQLAGSLAAKDDIFTIRNIGNTGIYYEKYAETSIYDENFKIYTTINIPTFTTEIHEIKSEYQTLKKLCDLITFLKNHPCKVLIRKINQEIEEVINNDVYTKHHIRKRRGLINAGGSVSKLLFGTMDDEDANKIYSLIQSIKMTWSTKPS